MDTDNGRARLERSAANWVKRANLLQEHEDGSVERRAAAMAEWAEDEPD